MAAVFQRQQELMGWDQAVLQSRTALILGVGGLGCSISIACCRLGLAKVILLDYDVVEEHNLNRQILYRAEHIHQSKVNCAAEELRILHVVSAAGTVVEAHHANAVTHWRLILSLVEQVDMVFNTIDYGDYFDYSIAKVCAHYHKPLVLGGTEPFYGHTVSYFLQGHRGEDKLYEDYHDLSNTEGILTRLTVDQLLRYEDVSFLPKDNHPVTGGSTVYSAGICSYLMVSAMINYLMALHDRNVRDGIVSMSSEAVLPKEPRPFPAVTVIFNLMAMTFDRWD